MSDPIKIGPKGRHVKIPEGWERVTSGVCQKGDKFLDASRASFEGKVSWVLTDKEDYGVEFDFFDVLIRENTNDHKNQG